MFRRWTYGFISETELSFLGLSDCRGNIKLYWLFIVSIPVQGTLMCLFTHEASVKAPSFSLARGERPTPLAPARARIPPRVRVREWATLGLLQTKVAHLPAASLYHLKRHICSPSSLPRRSTRVASGPGAGEGPSGDWRVNKENIFHAFFCVFSKIIASFRRKVRFCGILKACFGEACCSYLILLSLSFPPSSPFKNQQIHSLNSCTSVLNR